MLSYLFFLFFQVTERNRHQLKIGETSNIAQILGKVFEPIRSSGKAYQLSRISQFKSFGTMKNLVNVTLKKEERPLAALLTMKHLNKDGKKTELQWGEHTHVNASNGTCVTGEMSVIRYLARKFEETGIYGGSILESTEVDHWLDFSQAELNNGKGIFTAVNYLNDILAPRTYLVGHSFTIADFAIWSALQENKSWQGLTKKGSVGENIARWFKFCSVQPVFVQACSMLPTANQQKEQSQAKNNSEKKSAGNMQGRMEEGGKFVDLPGATKGNVVIRFPPEASGYLHIGHAKAALLNQYYKESYEGKLIMRFDDTNPEKENEHFEKALYECRFDRYMDIGHAKAALVCQMYKDAYSGKFIVRFDDTNPERITAHYEKVILEDIKLLQLTPDMYSRTSDHFDLFLKYAEKIIKDGNAFCDDTPADVMKEMREKKEPSSKREQSIEKNLEMWTDMVQGNEKGLKSCLRAKIDYQSDNGCLRDPVMYRCKNEPHLATGYKFK
eukprot:gene17782-19558_t